MRIKLGDTIITARKKRSKPHPRDVKSYGIALKETQRVIHDSFREHLGNKIDKEI